MPRCLVALPLIALFLATVLLSIEKVICVLSLLAALPLAWACSLTDLETLNIRSTCYMSTVCVFISTYYKAVRGCVLVVQAWTYEYGLNQIYVGGVFTGTRPPVFPPRGFTIPPMYHEGGSNSSGG